MDLLQGRQHVRQYCAEQGFDTFASYEVEGPKAGVHSWWNGSSWSTSGNNNVCYQTDLTCRTDEVCGNGFDDDGDGWIDEDC